MPSENFAMNLRPNELPPEVRAAQEASRAEAQKQKAAAEARRAENNVVNLKRSDLSPELLAAIEASKKQLLN